MRLAMLGPLVVRDSGGGLLRLDGRRQRVALAALGLRADLVVGREQLAEDIWGTEQPEHPARALSTIVSRLRSGLGDPARVRAEGSGYRLALAPDRVDVHAFDRGVDAGLAALAEGHHHEARSCLRDALHLWRDEPLADLGDAPLCASVRPRLVERRLQALEARIEADLALGNAERLVAELVDLVAEHPLRERLVGQLMRALAGTGRRGDALRAFEAAREHLAEKLGVDPSEELSALHVAILRGQVASPPAAMAGGPSSARDRQPGDPPRARVPFPQLPSGDGPFVGRTDLLERLRSTWAAVCDRGGTHVVLLVGEAGVGKTRTMVQSAREAFDRGGNVLAGRCDEELSTPYQPFVEALDWQVDQAPDAPLGRSPGELGRLLPELTWRVADLPPPVASFPEAAQHRLFAAVASWIVQASQDRGLLLLIDDLHWATRPTLQLLSHVVRVAAADPAARLLVTAAHRDTDIDQEHPLSSALVQLRRAAPVDELLLEGLSEDEMRLLVEQAAGHASGDTATELIRTLRRETGGNPFFVGEVLRDLLETGSIDRQDGRWKVALVTTQAVPDGVREVVHHRLARLSARTQEVLRLAAVVGLEAGVPVLAHLTDGGVDAVLDAVEEALAARLLTETEPGRLRFTHALVRVALRQTLSKSRQLRLHAQISDALEALQPDDVAAIAHHALLSVPVDGRRQRALGYAVAAGERALTRRAVGDARRWFEQALELLDSTPDVDEAIRLRAMHGLGVAQRDEGDIAYRDTLLRSARDALDVGQIDLAARAASDNSRLTISMVDAVDRDRLRLLEELLPLLDDLPEERIRVLGRLSSEMTFASAPTERRLSLVDETVAAARETGDLGLEAWALITTAVPGTVPTRAQMLVDRGDRATVLADQTGDRTLRCMARYMAAGAQLAVGGIAEARQAAEDAEQLATDEAPPFVQWITRCMTAQFIAYDGDLAGAREQNERCLEFGEQLGEPDARYWWAAVEGALALCDGGELPVADATRQMNNPQPQNRVLQAVQLLSILRRGREEEARRLLVDYGLDDPTIVAENWLTLATLELLARIAFELRLSQLGGALLPLVVPHRGQMASFWLACLQPMTFTESLAAAAAGHIEQAVEAAHDNHRLLAARGLRAHVPEGSLRLAQVLLLRGRPDDLAQARQAAANGLRAAQAMNMRAKAAELEDLLARLP